jgi:CHAD domain-containing protein
MGSLEVERAWHRVLDREGKTVVRLCVERLGSGTRKRWLHVRPVRGYPAAARRVRKELTEVLGAPVAPPDLVALAARSGGRQPGDYSGRLAVPLADTLTAPAAVGLVVDHLAAAVVANEHGVRDQTDTEFLHDYRVAIRRLRTVVSSTPGALPGDRAEGLGTELVWLADLTSPARDHDVHLLDIAEDPVLAPLEPIVRRHRDDAYAALVAAMDSDRYRAVVDELRAVADAAVDAAGPPVVPEARQWIWSAYRKLRRQGRAVTEDSPIDDLHRVRKSAKRLRYLLEAFEPLFAGRPLTEAVRELKVVQDNLGALQDGEVQRAALLALAEELGAKGAGRPEVTETLLDIGTRRAHLLEREAAARAEFAGRFARFDDDGNRARYRSLFRPE